MGRDAVVGRGAETSAGYRIARAVIPSLGNYCLLLMLVLLLANGWRFLHDSDTGWHVRTGDWILTHGQVPRTGIFSYTMPNAPWVDFEWLSDVLMSAIHRARGLAGLVGASILLLAVTYGALYRVTTRRGADMLTALVLTFIAAFASSVHWLARPHLLSIPLVFATWLLIEGHRRTGSRWLYAVPLVTLLWANLHSAFVVTFPLLAIYAIATPFEIRARDRASWGSAILRGLPYVATALLAALASLVNPYGLGIHREALEFMGNRTLLAGIQEFRSPDFQTPDGMLIEVLLVLAAFAAIRAARRGRYAETGLVLFWAHLVLQSQRHVTLAVMVLVPIIGEQASAWLADASMRAAQGARAVNRAIRGAREWYAGMVRTDRKLSGAAGYGVTIAAMLFAVWTGAADGLLRSTFSPRRFPVKAVDYIEQERARGNFRGRSFAHDQWGGYLIYRLSPDPQVFVDGRYHLYGRGTVPDDMAAVSEVEPTWSAVLDRWQVEWMLVPRESPLTTVAITSGRWALQYADSTANLLVRATGVQRPRL